MKNTIIMLITEAITLGYASVTVILFLMAYFNDYQITMTINNFGEAKPEFVLFFIFTGLLLSNFYLKAIDMIRHEKQKQNV